MKSFEIVPNTADVAIKVKATTRAGLLTAALQGMFAAARPDIADEESESVREFSIEADDFARLLVDLLNEALRNAGEHREAYVDVRFSLITDKKAVGAFVGKPAGGFRTEIKAATSDGLKVEKNEKGEWETTVAFGA